MLETRPQISPRHVRIHKNKLGPFFAVAHKAHEVLVVYHRQKLNLLVQNRSVRHQCHLPVCQNHIPGRKLTSFENS